MEAAAGPLLPPPTAAPPVPGGSVTVHAPGTALCNCTDSSARMSLCHSEEVEVRIGSQVLNVSTQQSASSCVSQTVPPGECRYFRYNFTCTHSFWGGWDCHPESTSLEDRPADDKTDC